MALLTPHHTYSLNGVIVKEKIIPDGTRWKDAAKAAKAGFAPNALYKKQQKLSSNTGKAQYVTIHNTNDLAGTNDDGEQYTRATYNENMGSVRVHFYVDDLGAWQNLKAGTGMCAHDPVGAAEVSWHAGDGSAADGGNMTSISIEIIMKDTPEHDKKAYDNGARIAAWMLWKHGLSTEQLVTHTYWVNQAVGQAQKNIDEQCTTLVKGQKWCPTYIFQSTDHAIALKNWKAFKALTQQYLDALHGRSDTPTAQPSKDANKTAYTIQAGAFSKPENAQTTSKKLTADGFPAAVAKDGAYYKVYVGAFSEKAQADALLKQIKAKGYTAFITTQNHAVASIGTSTSVQTTTKALAVGDRVRLTANATIYGKNTRFASWVYQKILYVRSVSGERIVVSTVKTGAVTGAVDRKYLEIV